MRFTSLFPYTTLFRSQGHALLTHRQVQAEVAHDRRDQRGVRQLAGVAHRDREDSHDLVAVGDVARGVHRDRKSTRLNSSHPVISYAVFSLKIATISLI